MCLKKYRSFQFHIVLCEALSFFPRIASFLSIEAHICRVEIVISYFRSKRTRNARKHLGKSTLKRWVPRKFVRNPTEVLSKNDHLPSSIRGFPVPYEGSPFPSRARLPSGSPAAKCAASNIGWAAFSDLRSIRIGKEKWSAFFFYVITLAPPYRVPLCWTILCGSKA